LAGGERGRLIPLGDKGGSEEAEAFMDASDNARFEQFVAVLLTELLERTKKNMEFLTPERKPCTSLPFIQTPSFVDIYSEVVKVGIFPVLMSRRPVRAIQGDVDWPREGREYLLTVLDDRANPVFQAWDYAWESLWSERKPAAPSPSSSHGRQKKSGGFLGALFGRKDTSKSKDTQPETGGEVMAGLYTMLNQLAERRAYLPLFADDVKVFKGLVRVKPSKLRDAWKELQQYHHQEFNLSGQDQAKPGVLSDALQKWHYNLPDRIGEFLVVRAAVDLENVTKPFVGKYIRQSARSQEEAERNMPYLATFWKAMDNAVGG
jgi:hypothetical protein